ncbi:hypothetical protein HORM4_530061 [Vibrio harveyi]|nr:hypothetical protein HORM4_530061 [Vibrio harveyi]
MLYRFANSPLEGEIILQWYDTLKLVLFSQSLQERFLTDVGGNVVSFHKDMG